MTLKTHHFLILLFILSYNGVSTAQVGIGTNTPNTSAKLDIVSEDKGILITRVALTGTRDESTISSGNIESLLVYNTTAVADVVPGYYYWDGTIWVRLLSGNTLSSDTNTTNTALEVENGNLVLTDSDRNTVQTSVSALVSEPWFGQNNTQLDPLDDIGATENTENIYHLGDVGIGTTLPLGKLHVSTNTGSDVILSRFLNEDKNDMDLDFVRGFGAIEAPEAVSGEGVRLGGVRYRTLVNPDPNAILINQFAAIPPSAEIAAETDGVPTLTSAPGRLIFETTPENTIETEVRMVIKHNGNIGVGTDANTPTEILDITSGNLRIRDINTTTEDRLVVADAQGTLKTSTASVDTSDDAWSNNAPSSIIELSTLSNGTTARTASTSLWYLRDDGRMIFGDPLNTGLNGDSDNSGFLNFRRTSGTANLKLSSSDNGAVVFLESFGNGSSVLRFFKSRGTDSNDFSSHQLVQDGDMLGALQYWGYNNNTSRPAERMAFSAAMQVEVDGTVTPDIDGGVPSRFIWRTRNTSLRKNMILDSDGNLGIGIADPTEKLEVNGKIKAVDVNFSGLPTFDDEATATSGGLTAGDMYKTSTGELRIKL